MALLGKLVEEPSRRGRRRTFELLEMVIKPIFILTPPPVFRQPAAKEGRRSCYRDQKCPDGGAKPATPHGPMLHRFWEGKNGD